MSLFIISFYYISILISIIGVGFFSARFLKINISQKDIALFGFIGLIILTFVSYLTNLIFAHNFIHNIFILSIGLIFFFYGIVKKEIDKNNIYKIILISILLLIFSLLSKTHDDFGWYHLPYTLNLVYNKFQFGLGHFNHGFRTPSSLFYINSLFYLPIIKFYTFNFAQLYIFLFGLIYLYKRIFDKFNKDSFIFFYSLLAFVFIIVVFYRLAEHGTDRSGQIILFIIFVFIFDILKDKFINFNKVNILLILLIYIITIKTYFIIYVLLFLPIIFKVEDFRSLQKLFFSKLIIFSLIFLILHFNIQVANTGCLLYPMNFTCYSGFEWSINKNEVILMGEWYELWSKSGANPNFRVENTEEYIKNFNWVSRWFSEYFFNKISDLSLGIVLILLIFYYAFKNKSEKLIHINLNEIRMFLFCVLVLSIIWFTKFPQLRYGGFIIIANIFFLPFCIYVLRYKINKKIITRAKIIILISLIIFSTRNVKRILYEIEFYQYKPLENAYFKIETPEFEKKNLGEGIEVNITKGSCWSIPQPCFRSEAIEATKKNNYIIYRRN